MGSYWSRFRNKIDGVSEKCFTIFCRSVSGNSISDHLSYYGVEMGCDESMKCKIVMDNRLASYGRTDGDGNFIVMRDPSTSVVKLNSDKVTAI